MGPGAPHPGDQGPGQGRGLVAKPLSHEEQRPTRANPQCLCAVCAVRLCPGCPAAPGALRPLHRMALVQWLRARTGPTLLGPQPHGRPGHPLLPLHPRASRLLTEASPTLMSQPPQASWRGRALQRTLGSGAVHEGAGVGAGGLGWRTVGALDQGCAQGNRAWGWPPRSRASLCPGQGARGIFPPRPSSPQTRGLGEGTPPTHTPMHTHPTQKVLRTAALGSSESAGPS